MKTPNKLRIALILLIVGTMQVTKANTLTKARIPKIEVGLKYELLKKGLSELAKTLTISVAIDAAIDELKVAYADLWYKAVKELSPTELEVLARKIKLKQVAEKYPELGVKLTIDVM